MITETAVGARAGGQLPRAGLPTLLLALGVLAAAAPAARAHPIPRGSHDRTVTVRLARDAVVVEYGLDLDLYTLIYTDLPEQAGQNLFTQESEFCEAFERIYRARLAAGLAASLDGRPLSFACEQSRLEKLPDHLHYEFVFRAAWDPGAGGPHTFALRETNFEKEGEPMPGQVRLTLAAEPGVRLLRPVPAQAGERPAEAPPRAAGEGPALLGLFLGSRRGFLVLLFLSAVLGAAHALTPGHGKTLVAAYLVGERGTVGHAVVLGVVTTLAHTGVVLILALVLALSFPGGTTADERSSIQQALELGGGILIAGLGFWLLLRRLAGQADHVHLGGSGHHHHHHGHEHTHADHAHADDPSHPHAHGHPYSHPVSGGWWGLVVLGVSGGIVPCWDAVALLLAAVAMNRLALALPMLLAFSAGLAGVLVAIGILVVRTRALAGKRWERSRLFRALPLVSAALVTGLGLWLCYQSVRAGKPSAAEERWSLDEGVRGVETTFETAEDGQ